MSSNLFINFPQYPYLPPVHPTATKTEPALKADVETARKYSYWFTNDKTSKQATYQQLNKSEQYLRSYANYAGYLKKFYGESVSWVKGWADPILNIYNGTRLLMNNFLAVGQQDNLSGISTEDVNKLAGTDDKIDKADVDRVVAAHDNNITTKALGEEGGTWNPRPYPGDVMTTQAVGEEGGGFYL